MLSGVILTPWPHSERVPFESKLKTEKESRRKAGEAGEIKHKGGKTRMGKRHLAPLTLGRPFREPFAAAAALEIHKKPQNKTQNQKKSITSPSPPLLWVSKVTFLGACPPSNTAVTRQDRVCNTWPEGKGRHSFRKRCSFYPPPLFKYKNRP